MWTLGCSWICCVAVGLDCFYFSDSAWITGVCHTWLQDDDDDDFFSSSSSTLSSIFEIGWFLNSELRWTLNSGSLVSWVLGLYRLMLPWLAKKESAFSSAFSKVYLVIFGNWGFLLHFFSFNFCLLLFVFKGQGFTVWPWLSWTHLVDQADLELEESFLGVGIKATTSS